MGGGAKRAQQVHLTPVSVRKITAVADAHHLRSARFTRSAALARDMGKIPSPPWICDVDNRRAVRLLRTGDRVQRSATVVTDLGEPVRTAIVNDGLVRTPVL
jgi:hypothetical protein